MSNSDALLPLPSPQELKAALKAFKKRLKLTCLDDQSRIGVGPTFPSATKQFEQFPGVELLRAVAAEIRLPAFAIGGIDRENLGEVLAAGFTRIAVSGAVTAADDPRQAAKELLEELQKHHGDTEGTEQRC